jgi:hypothetical protein
MLMNAQNVIQSHYYKDMTALKTAAMDIMPISEYAQNVRISKELKNALLQNQLSVELDSSITIMNVLIIVPKEPPLIKIENVFLAQQTVSTVLLPKLVQDVIPNMFYT